MVWYLRNVLLSIVLLLETGISDKIRSANTTVHSTASALKQPSLLLVAAGRGTTGTCNVFRHLCALKLTVVHYFRMCNARGPIEERISRIQHRLVYLMLHPHLINTSVLEPLLGEFVDSGVQAVVDSPFPYFMSTLMALVPHAQVLLTTRSPLEWAISRFKHHPGNSFICRCELHSMLEDPFDAVACNSLAATQGFDSVKGGMVNLREFGRHADVCKCEGQCNKTQKHGVDLIAEAMTSYNQRVQRLVPIGQLHTFSFFDFTSEAEASTEFRKHVLWTLRNRIAPRTPYVPRDIEKYVEWMGSHRRCGMSR